MARVNPEKIIDHLAPDMRRVLEKVVREAIPGAEFDARALFTAFTREVGKSFSMFEQVPDSCVQT